MKKINVAALYGEGTESRVFRMEFRADENKPHQVTGYGAMFDTLSENLGGFREKIAVGAFDDVLQDDVRALINHDPNLILGRTNSNTLGISVDVLGLRYNIDMPATSYGDDLMVSLKRGDITQSSFAFSVEKDSWDEDDDGRIVRTIEKIKRLFDVSPVTYPAYPDTTVAARTLTAHQQDCRCAINQDAQRRRRELDLLQAGGPSFPR